MPRGLETRPPTPRENGRELHAVLLLFVWFLGVEALPLRHQLAHASLGAHEHTDAGFHVHSDGTRHAHAMAPSDATDGAERTLAAPAASGSHGHGSLAHRSLLFPAPPLAMPVLPSALFAYLLAALCLVAASAREPEAAARARGPPAGRAVLASSPLGA